MNGDEFMTKDSGYQFDEVVFVMEKEKVVEKSI